MKEASVGCIIQTDHKDKQIHLATAVSVWTTFLIAAAMVRSLSINVAQLFNISLIVMTKKVKKGQSFIFKKKKKQYSQVQLQFNIYFTSFKPRNMNNLRQISMLLGDCVLWK